MKKNRYSLIIILGLISLLLIVFFCYFLYSEIRKISQETIFLKTKIVSMENFRKIYPTLSPNLKKVDNLFINPDLPIGFIKFLEETAKQQQLNIEISLEPGKRKEGDWSFLIFEIRTTGLVINFLRFFEKIENSPYLIEIKDLTMHRIIKREIEIERAEEIEIQAVLTLRVFTR